MMQGIEFSQQRCPHDPAFMVVRIRMPSNETDEFYGEFTGLAAQIKVTKWIFACASGILAACGMQNAALTIASISQKILAVAGQWTEDEAAAVAVTPRNGTDFGPN